MVMIAIVDDAGQPMYRQSRDLIRPELSHALGRWRREVEMSLTAEHDADGAHRHQHDGDEAFDQRESAPAVQTPPVAPASRVVGHRHNKPSSTPPRPRQTGGAIRPVGPFLSHFVRRTATD